MNNQSKLMIDFGQSINSVENFEIKVLQAALTARKAILSTHDYETPIKGFDVKASKNKTVVITVLGRE